MDEAACKLCGGFGFLRRELPIDHPEFGKLVPCECRQTEEQDVRLARLQRYSSLGPLTRLTFANLTEQGRSANPRDRELFSALVKDARQFADKPEGWMLIHGPSGAGKTHVAAAIANSCLNKGTPALFVVVPDLLDHIRSSFSNNSEDTYDRVLEQVKSAPVLILDDLGTQNATQWAQEKLFQILNHRYNERTPTIVTTSLSLERLDERLRTRLTDESISKVYYVEAGARAVDQGIPDAFDLDHIRSMTFENFDYRLSHSLSPEGQTEGWSFQEARRAAEGLENAYRTALAFAERPENWLLIWGPNGCGKTHLAAAIANRCRARGDRPVFFTVADLLDYLRNLMTRDDGPSFLEAFNQLRSVPLLILDDLTAHSDVPWVRERLFQVINYRYNARLATVFTASTEAMTKLVEERILTRLNDPGVCVEVPITAPAYRVNTTTRPSALGRSSDQAAPRPRSAAEQRRRYGSGR